MNKNRNKISFNDLKRFKRIRDIRHKEKNARMIAEGLVRIYELEEGDKFEMLGHRYTVKKINAEIMYFKLSDFAGAELRTMSHGSYQLVTLIK